MSKGKRTPKRRSQEDLAAQYRQEGELRASIRALEKRTRAFALDAEFRKQCGAIAEHLTRAEALLRGTTETAGQVVAENITLDFQIRDLTARLDELRAHRDAGTVAPAARIEVDRIEDDFLHSGALQQALDMHAISRQQKLYAAEPSNAVERVRIAADEVRLYLQVLTEAVASIVKLSERITQLVGASATGGAVVADAETRCRSLEPGFRRQAEYLDDLVRRHFALVATRDELLSAVKDAEGR